MCLEQITGLLEDHLLDAHAESLTKFLGVLGNHVLVTVVKRGVERYLVEVALDFLITKLNKINLPPKCGSTRF
jgi:hypothetical protein